MSARRTVSISPRPSGSPFSSATSHSHQVLAQFSKRFFMVNEVCCKVNIAYKCLLFVSV